VNHVKRIAFLTIFFFFLLPSWEIGWIGADKKMINYIIRAQCVMYNMRVCTLKGTPNVFWVIKQCTEKYRKAVFLCCSLNNTLGVCVIENA